MSGRMACLFFAGVVLAACTPEESARGFIPAPDDIKAIVVGTDTKETVQKRLGNPTTAAEFGDDTWYYMSIYQSQTGFQLPKDVQRDIVAVAFDKGGKVSEVKHYSLADGKVVEFASRETPTRGRELTLLQQIFSAAPGAPITTNPNSPVGGGQGPGN